MWFTRYDLDTLLSNRELEMHIKLIEYLQWVLLCLNNWLKESLPAERKNSISKFNPVSWLPSELLIGLHPDAEQHS